MSPAGTYKITETGAVMPMAKVRAAAQVRPWIAALLFLLAHVPLALLMKRVGMLSTAHALGAFLLGLYWAVGNRPRLVACVGAYMAASEILWRMTSASVFWEFGKYGMALVFLVSMVRSSRLHPDRAALCYLLLLIPAAVPTLFRWEWWSARRDISFNLSGPFALMVAVMFFRGLRLRPVQVRRILWSLLAPLVGVVAIAVYAVMTSVIFFGQSSNEVASGGFGPNQVSSALGLGMTVAFLGMVDPRTVREMRLILFGLIVLFAGQSALTLSRSGLVIGLLCIGAAALFLVRSPATRIKMVLAGVLLLLIAKFVLIPQLDSFTGGAVSARFSNTNPTGRDKIMMVDLMIWMDHPVLGAGVGEAQVEREKYYRLIAAHNELTRMVAEHGVMGLVSIFLLLFMGWRSFRSARGARGKAVVAALLAFSFLFMLANGMRLALVSLTFGFAAARFLPDLRRRPPGREMGAGLEPSNIPAIPRRNVAGVAT